MTGTSSVLTPNLVVFLIILQRTATVGLWEQGWGVQGGEGGSLMLIPHMVSPHSKYLLIFPGEPSKHVGGGWPDG